MKAIELARRAAALGAISEAVRAYSLVLLSKKQEPLLPEDQAEAAAFLLQSSSGDYRLPYDTLMCLYKEGQLREDILPILLRAFYEPNVTELEERYERNIALLQEYPYLFRKDFLPFEELPILFFPYEDSTYFPFDPNTMEFSDKLAPKNEVIRHWFFQDLSKPVLAEDIFSQYELEYLRDNVRASEDVGYENHVYLCYTDWGVFCAYLQILDFQPLLEREKLVFLIEDEVGQYPIDFKERFHIDYSEFPLKPVSVREVSRLILHGQLSYHNGGDFFNEIFNAHPNLLGMTSLWVKKKQKNKDSPDDTTLEDAIEVYGDIFRIERSLAETEELLSEWENPALVRELYGLRHELTDKDLMVAWFLSEPVWNPLLDTASRIAPAIFYQPHCGRYPVKLEILPNGQAVPKNKFLDELYTMPALTGFRYVKTFLPMRRPTTRWGACVRFEFQHAHEFLQRAKEEHPEPTPPDGNHKLAGGGDSFEEMLISCGHLKDPDNRMLRDAVVVRFEDGKLNPKATFTAMAEFLDIPYAEALTYCSMFGVRCSNEAEGSGFNTATVYRTYDDYVNDDERRCIEFLQKDVYQFYGYGFQWYDGAPVDEATVMDWLSHTDKADEWMKKTMEIVQEFRDYELGQIQLTPEMREEGIKSLLRIYHRMREITARHLMSGLQYVNQNGKPMTKIPLLKLDPALLETEMYH